VTASAAEPTVPLRRDGRDTQRATRRAPGGSSPRLTESLPSAAPTGLTSGLFAETVRAAAGLRHPESLQVWTGFAARCGPCDAATVTVLDPDGTLRTVGGTEGWAEQADLSQFETGTGPGVEAVQGTVVVLAEDLRAASERWPRWAPRAVGLGSAAVMSLQLFTTETLGALNLYSTTPRRYGSADLDIATTLAAHVSAAVVQARDEQNLWRAIEARNLIGQAQGMLMARYGLSAEKAFAVLRRHSNHSNVKVSAVAEQLVSTGSLPAKASAVPLPDSGSRWHTSAGRPEHGPDPRPHHRW
jgi:GAF domain-containing protein